MLLARLTLLNTKTLGELVAARIREIAAEPKKRPAKSPRGRKTAGKGAALPKRRGPEH
jgi:hypothetical protein